MSKRKREVKIFGQEEITEAKDSLPDPIKPKLTYDAWWVMAQQRYKLKPVMQEVLFKHFKARGFLESGDFEAGIKDYGL